MLVFGYFLTKDNSVRHIHDRINRGMAHYNNIKASFTCVSQVVRRVNFVRKFVYSIILINIVIVAHAKLLKHSFLIFP